MHRFFVPVTNGIARLSSAQQHQLRHVLRLRDGDEVAVFDGSGEEWVARLQGDLAEIVEVRRGNAEPRTHLTLFQAAIKPARFELVLQKATELGVRRVVPFTCERSVAIGERPERWQAILVEAAEQSGRRIVPEMAGQRSFEECVTEAAQAAAFLPWEGATSGALRKTEGRVSLIIGPEGGFSKPEIEYARSKGVEVVSLGRRVLRSETAAIVAVALVLHLNEEL